ncbi:ABC transporter, ABC-G family, WBC-type [Lecanosticta acicola]|uniref:ABC transporter, ABC-G family, WBC-type n=1 Tax=Lecanosticta acicola TaxID=111012 RepID=A0AAI9EDI6_9PEZI|nr:ABC transporter, ABC-G family, WBC-type [Lecanosticta acicola]
MPSITMLPSLSSLSSELPAASSALATIPGFNDSQNVNMVGTLEYNSYAYRDMSESERGCYRKGALPVALASNDTCSPGFHCPNSNDTHPPQFCHPSELCQVQRANKATCDPQGVLEPKICANGHFCPLGGKRETLCPKGTFCPSGSVQPFNCSYGAICPAGSVRQIVIIPLFVTVAIDVALMLMVGVGFGISKWRKSRPKTYTTLARTDDKADQIELLQSCSPTERTQSPSISVSGPNAPVPGFARPASIHSRRASGRVDHYDGYADDDSISGYDDDMEDDLSNSPDMQRFIRSMTRTVETSSIGLSFDFENLSFETKGGRKILQGVTGTMPRGSCWGVIGGSGAGKSTFLNVLMGKAHTTNGSIKVNGHSKDMSKYKKLIGYVPQDDIVFPELTVRENILHSARIRLPTSWRDRAIQDHVDALIACLQLTHVRHSRVGDAAKPVVSGGQRKRVNIGMELAAAPMAIFLDEPTSGLDATSAASIMRLLRAISRLGVTCISIIHQPREQIFYGFDSLLLLAQGRSLYSGPTDEVQSYFESLGFAFPQRANPADTLMDIITGDGAQYAVAAGKHETDVSTLIEEWQSKGQFQVHDRHLSLDASGAAVTRNRRISDQSMTNSTAEQEESLRRTMKARGASWPAQVYYCWKRAMTQQVRNSTSFFFEVGVGGLAGVIIGLSAFAANGHLFQGIYHPPFTLLSSAVDYQSTPQLGLLGGMAIGLAASAPGFWVFGEEKLIYWRETASGHSRSAYYVGKLLSTLLRIGLSSLHFTVFLGVLATPLISFPAMYAANLAYFWCIYGLSSVVSVFVKRENGPLLAVLASLVIGVLGGVAPPLSKVKTWHMEWFWRLSPGVWYTEAYWSENLRPLDYLYELDLASKTIGFTLGQYGLDIGVTGRAPRTSRLRRPSNAHKFEAAPAEAERNKAWEKAWEKCEVAVGKLDSDALVAMMAWMKKPA